MCHKCVAILSSACLFVNQNWTKEENNTQNQRIVISIGRPVWSVTQTAGARKSWGRQRPAEAMRTPCIWRRLRTFSPTSPRPLWGSFAGSCCLGSDWGCDDCWCEWSLLCVSNKLPPRVFAMTRLDTSNMCTACFLAHLPMAKLDGAYSAHWNVWLLGGWLCKTNLICIAHIYRYICESFCESGAMGVDCLNLRVLCNSVGQNYQHMMWRGTSKDGWFVRAVKPDGGILIRLIIRMRYVFVRVVWLCVCLCVTNTLFGTTGRRRSGHTSTNTIRKK